MQIRESWASRFGLICAMAGCAIGLGNFLRFPVQAAKNGGGVFMIPYFVALLILGIPLMWCEWAMGRLGGTNGHGTMPGIFSIMWKNKLAKYVGILGLFLPLTVLLYYIFIESWTLAYSFFSVTGKYFGIMTREEMGAFLGSFTTGNASKYFGGIVTVYIFFIITMFFNVAVTWRGISKGIELLGKIALPMLFAFAVVLIVRIFMLGNPDPAYPDRNVLNGLAFIWDPDFSRLWDAKVWLAAAGQMFFTLSLGFGVKQCYASYLREKDDVALSGFSTVMTNEFAEVILGGSIAIPIAVAFFGGPATKDIANAGAFDLAFQSLPLIFQKMPAGQFFGTLWFGLLFIAAITSSVALAQPLITFFEDEFGMEKQKANMLVWGTAFVFVQLVIFGNKANFLNELDFWAGTFGITLFAFLEIVIFAWVFGMPRAWEEINKGADIRIPRFFYYIIKYVMPIFLLVLLLSWFFQSGIDVINFKGVKPEDIPWLKAARYMMLFFLIAFSVLVYFAFRSREKNGQQ